MVPYDKLQQNLTTLGDPTTPFKAETAVLTLGYIRPRIVADENWRSRRLKNHNGYHRNEEFAVKLHLEYFTGIDICRTKTMENGEEGWQ